MTSRIENTIARQQEKINSGAYYESHQQLRVIAARYIKQANYDAAANILAAGATALLKAGSQQGAAASGGDLAIMLAKEVYGKAGLPAAFDEDGIKRKERLIGILKEFPSDEPSRKKYIGEILSWSARTGEIERGDPDLHHAIGAIYAAENDPYEAEKHLVLGTNESAEILGRLEYEWYTHDPSPRSAGVYAVRAVIPCLLAGSLAHAHKAYSIFTSRLRSLHTNNNSDNSNSAAKPSIHHLTTATSEIDVFTNIPLLNFAMLLLLAVQRARPDLFHNLARHYIADIRDVPGLEAALVHVGEIYFDIQPPRQSNPLINMMGMMFGGGGAGGGGGGGGARGQTLSPGQTAAGLPSMDMD